MLVHATCGPPTGMIGLAEDNAGVDGNDSDWPPAGHSLCDTPFIPKEDIILRSHIPIGEGSYGTVYRGIRYFEDVAVKILNESPEGWNPDSSQQAQLQSNRQKVLEMLAKEVEIGKKLLHKNVIGFRGICLDPPCIVTEWCERGSLWDVIKKRKMYEKELTWERRLEIAAGAAQGMGYLHCRRPSILHMDLKSPNLLLTKNWEVKVADFGLSKFLHSAEDVRSADNPMWLAPEVLRGRDPDRKSDVYPFGIILWELMTLRPPWTSENYHKDGNDDNYDVFDDDNDDNDDTPNVYQVFADVLFRDARPEIPKDLSGLPGGACDVLPKYIDLMKRCWETDPAKRPSYSTIVRELWGMLREVRGEPDVPITPALVQAPWPWTQAYKFAVNGGLKTAASNAAVSVRPSAQASPGIPDLIADMSLVSSLRSKKSNLRSISQKIGSALCLNPFACAHPKADLTAGIHKQPEPAQTKSGAVRSKHKQRGRNRFRTARLGSGWIPARFLKKLKHCKSDTTTTPVPPPHTQQIPKVHSDPRGLSAFEAHTPPPEVTSPFLSAQGSEGSIPDLDTSCVVQPGDSLPLICERYSVDLPDMLRLNSHIRDPVKIPAGETLLLPTVSSAEEAARKLPQRLSGLRSDVGAWDFMGRFSPSQKRWELVDLNEEVQDPDCAPLTMVDGDLPSGRKWGIIRDYVMTNVKPGNGADGAWQRIVDLVGRHEGVPDARTWKLFQALFFDTNTQGFRVCRHWRVLKQYLVKDIVPVLQE